MRRILLIVIALILYGSLYPWQFHRVLYGSSPLWILLHSWPDTVNRYLLWDLAINVTLYLPLGLFAYLSWSERTGAGWRMAGTLLLATVLSAGIEMLQLFDDSRQCSATDLISNVAGAAIGAGFGALYRVKLERAVRQRTAARLLNLSGAVLLLSCWLAYQVFPLFPAWGRTTLIAKLKALGSHGALPVAETLLVFAEWLTVACLLEALLEKKSGHILAVFLLVLPVRLIITHRTLTWADVAGAAAAMGLWILAPRVHVRRATPMILASALVVGELAPFHFEQAANFNWVPFRGFFESTWQNGFIILFRKSFWYGSVIWLWRAAGYPLGPVTVAAALALGLLEWVQVYLPGRTPEITDAVLAVVMAMVLWLADPSAERIKK